MSDAAPSPSPMASGHPSAGQLLQAAREAQGMSLDILASIIKVSVAKLEALEADDMARLPDPNFNRALAMTVCRALKIDASPILAAMPAAVAASLLAGKPGLNEPFRDFGNTVLTFESSSTHWRAPRVPRTLLAPLALMLLAALIYLLPESLQWPWGQGHKAAGGVEVAQSSSSADVASAPEVMVQPAASAAVEVLTSAPPQAAAASVAVVEVPSAPSAAGPASEPVPMVAAVASVPAAAVATASAPAASGAAVSEPAAAAGNGQVVLATTEVAWIEVRDRAGVRLLSRQIQAGEHVAVSGQIPLKVVAGNAPTVSIQFNGKPVDLAAVTRQNVARIELK